MTDHAIVEALNTFASQLDQAAAMFEAIGRLPAVEALRTAPRIEPGSPLARMVDQGKRFAEIMPQPSAPTTWEPEGWISTSK